jgi:hypothetical protein
MNTMRLDYPIAVLCRAFEVSRSGFYAWSKGELSQRAQVDERLKVAIKAVHKQSRETYGTRRVQPELEAQGGGFKSEAQQGVDEWKLRIPKRLQAYVRRPRMANEMHG